MTKPSMSPQPSMTPPPTVITHPDVRPFQVHIPQEDLDDLRQRIAASRRPARELVAYASQGVQLATLQALTRYCGTGYDLRRVEARLNALPQFKTGIDGLDIH